MRPRDDVNFTENATDPYEVIHHLRESQAKWQETCQRLRDQRDEANTLIASIAVVLNANELFPSEIIQSIDRLIEDWEIETGHRVPDGASQVAG